MSSFIFFIVIMATGGVIFLLLKGWSDRPKAVGAPKRTMPTRPIEPVIFKCPIDKCPVCAGAADKMRQEWDGFRKVTWICGYCGNISVQELTDDKFS